MNFCLVYRMSVFPTGRSAPAPAFEVTNRIIRQYFANRDRFLRVSFLDIDGEKLPVQDIQPVQSNDDLIVAMMRDFQRQMSIEEKDEEVAALTNPILILLKSKLSNGIHVAGAYSRGFYGRCCLFTCVSRSQI